MQPATVLTELDPTDIFSADENQENNRKLLVASAAVASTPTILMALQDENNQNENEIKRILDTVNVAIVALNAADLGNIVNNIAADLNGGTATGTSTITTEQISDAKEVNSPPTGVLEITGVAVIGQTLRVDAAVINDADGTGTFTYQWLANNQEIAAATTSSLTLSTSNTKIGEIITVIVSYTDGATPPTAESVESLSAKVAPVVIAITSIPSVIKGETLTLTASQTPAGQTIAWTIQDGSSNIASIAADGETIHGVAIGSVVVVATAQDGTSVTQQFTVSAARATGITVPSTIANSSVFDNSSINLMANVLPPAADQSVSWSITAGTQFASLSGNLLSGTAPGTVTLVVSVDSSPTLTANHTVTVKKVAITGISITSADTVDHRGTLELTVRVEPAGATNPAVTWSRISGSSQIASINGSTLTGVRPGSIRIRATAVDDSSITAEQDIRVVGIPVTSVEITTTGPFVDGDTTEFAATVLPNNASTPGLTWTVENKRDGGDANFHIDNIFNALAPGVVTIRAT
ncbi:MAG: hypothetical protein HAW58_01245, partial [Candidatus Thioglobus sp.]|nr:hypothetical protein [Candidatus Thioglobus sp.]